MNVYCLLFITAVVLVTLLVAFFEKLEDFLVHLLVGMRHPQAALDAGAAPVFLDVDNVVDHPALAGLDFDIGPGELGQHPGAGNCFAFGVGASKTSIGIGIGASKLEYR